MVTIRGAWARGRVSCAFRRGLGIVAVAFALGAAQSPTHAQAPAAPVAPGTVFEVRKGDSFARIAAQITGSPLQWRKVYHPQKSGLPNPSLVIPGSQFELIREADGSTYLRLRPVAGARPPATVATAATAAPVAAPKPAEPVRFPDSITVGLLPNIPAPALMAMNEPLKAYLERSNRNKVNLATAPNFRAFFESTMKGEFDIAVMAANLARVAQLDGALVPVAVYEPRIRALMIGTREQGIKSARELKGKTVVFQNPQSLVALYARQWLQKQDLLQERDFEVKAARTDIGVGRMLLTGEAAGAFMSNGEFRSIPAADAERLVIVEQIAEIPNFVVLAHPRLGAAVIQALRSQFQAFPADPVDGAAFTKAAGVARIVDVDERQMAELDAFLEPTRRAMGLVK